MKKYVMALDAGTTSNRCILFNERGEICSIAQKEFTQYFPKPGWVEHDANEIWSTQLGVAVEAMSKIGATAKDIAEREKVDLRLYKVIYNAIEDIEAAMKGMLDPVFEEKIIGHAEVRQTFKASGVGMIAGSYVLDGKIVRGCKARVTRDGEVIFDGDLASLKRFKDDVKEVASGYECGLVFEKFNDIKEEDKVELYVMEEVPR